MEISSTFVKVHHKSSSGSLIERCLSADPSNRPSFKEILSKLVYNENHYLENVEEWKYRISKKSLRIKQIY